MQQNNPLIMALVNTIRLTAKGFYPSSDQLDPIIIRLTSISLPAKFNLYIIKCKLAQLALPPIGMSVRLFHYAKECPEFFTHPGS
jgi:hypothetical protein